MIQGVEASDSVRPLHEVLGYMVTQINDQFAIQPNGRGLDGSINRVGILVYSGIQAHGQSVTHSQHLNKSRIHHSPVPLRGASCSFSYFLLSSSPLAGSLPSYFPELLSDGISQLTWIGKREPLPADRIYHRFANSTSCLTPIPTSA